MTASADARAACWRVVADGMGGRSGGRKASDQVLLTAAQLFDALRARPATNRHDMLRQHAGRRAPR